MFGLISGVRVRGVVVLLCPEGPPRTGIPGKARENPGERPKTAEIGAWDPPGKPPPAGVPIDSGGPDSAFEDCALGIFCLFVSWPGRGRCGGLPRPAPLMTFILAAGLFLGFWRVLRYLPRPLWSVSSGQGPPHPGSPLPPTPPHSYRSAGPACGYVFLVCGVHG